MNHFINWKLPLFIKWKLPLPCLLLSFRHFIAYNLFICLLLCLLLPEGFYVFGMFSLNRKVRALATTDFFFFFFVFSLFHFFQAVFETAISHAVVSFLEIRLILCIPRGLRNAKSSSDSVCDMVSKIEKIQVSRNYFIQKKTLFVVKSFGAPLVYFP